ASPGRSRRVGCPAVRNPRRLRRNHRRPRLPNRHPAYEAPPTFPSQEVNMGLLSRDIHSMDDLFVHGLQDVYYAENEILKALPTMIEKAAHGELKKGLQKHLAETRKQVQRLEQVFRMHGKEPQGKSCPGIDGILEEGNTVMGEVEDKDVLDAAMIAAAQAVEHYEITRYGALMAWAKELGRS